MPTEKRVPSLIVNTLTEEQYQALENPSDTEMWVTPYDESILPDQTGQSGKYLTTNGSNASWATVDTLPSQTGQSGKFLTTDGTDPSWAAIPATVSADGTTIENNSNVLTTIGVKDQNTSNAIKTWTGTKAQFEAIATKDADTIYNITDDTVLTDFANTSLSNLTNAGKIVGAGLGMPSSTYIDLTLGASGTTYTAPADGYYFIDKIKGTSTGYVTVSSKLGNYSVSPASTSDRCSILFPVLKGDTIAINYGATGTTNSFRFYYAEGSKSEAN